MKLQIRFLLLGVALAAAAGCGNQQSSAPASAAPPSAAVDASTLKVVAWGPKNTKAGIPFNTQPDGNSGLFVKLSGKVPLTKFTATISDKPLSGVVASGDVVTATIPSDYLTTPGSYPIELQVPAQDLKIAVGTFTINGDGAAPTADTAADPRPTVPEADADSPSN